MTFYLLRWTYFNDVNVRRNILMNPQLKKFIFMSSDEKKWNKTEKRKKNNEKENSTDESDFSENEIDLNSLKPFEFKPKTNIEDINSSQKQPSEVAKGVLRNFAKFTEKHLCQCLFFNKVAGLSPATLLKKRVWYRCSPVNFAKFLRTSFFIEHLRTTASE